MEAGEEGFGVSPVPSSAGEAPSQLLLAVRAQLPGLRQFSASEPSPPAPYTLPQEAQTQDVRNQTVPLGLAASGTSSG